MSNENVAAWEIAAREAADEIGARLRSMDTFDAQVNAVERAEATGSNSLDEVFWGALLKGEHLTDSFLANA